MATARESQVLRAIPLLIAVCLLSFPAQAQYGGGTGMQYDPYQIFTAEQMNEIGPNLDVDSDRHFILMEDIDLSDYTGTDFNIIGADRDSPFTGVFDGNGHTILNFTYVSLDADHVGLFGYIDGPEAQIKDLGLVNANIDAGTGNYVGSLVGMNIHGTISFCSVQGDSVTGGKYVSGLVGYNAGFITDSYSNTIVLGIMFVGGLAGENSYLGFREAGIISNCYSTGTVSGNVFVGGLVGQNGTWLVGGGEISALEGQIDNCYSTCNVTGKAMIGGLVGFNNVGIITQCYSNGIVSGNELVGGLIGKNNARVTVCFWDVETSGLTSSAAGIGKTTVEMQTADTFTNWGTCGPFWTIDEGYDYPHLAWENIPGELIADPYGGGTGTAEDPYLIYTAEQLNAIGLSFCGLDKHFKLMADIDLSAFDGKEGRPAFNVIGLDRWDAFAGVFDGNDHVVSNLTLTGEDNLGMFGRLERGAEVRNLGIVDVNIVGSGSFIGALAGESDSDLTRCYSSGTVRGDWSVGGLVGASFGWIDCGPAVTQCHSTCVVSGNDWLGGLVGNNGSFITQCYSTGEISGRDRVGGLVGYNHSDTVTKCYSTSAVSGDSDVGGLVGHNYNGSITTSYSTGTVSGKTKVGGLVGVNDSYRSNLGYITMSYSTGRVYGDEEVGGLVGDNQDGKIASSFWDIETSEQATSAGGMGLTTADMQDINTYLNVGWDFVDETINGTCDYWQISPGDYPRCRYHSGNSPVMPEGLGTAQEPYLIRDARDLGTVWFKPIAHYRLETSLDLSGIIWSMAVVPWFGGTFDGNGYVISNLQIQGSSYLGLFGELGPEAKLSNLGLEAVNVNGDWNVGGLVGYNCASITNCYSIGTVTGHNYVGGLVGGHEHGSIATSHSTCMVSGNVWVGGLVGDNYRGSINASYSTGEVNGNLPVGGLVGYNSGGSITTSYSTGTVSGDVRVGGLVGYNFPGIITASYSSGTVTGNEDVGGLVGYNEKGSITKSYSTGMVSGTNLRVGGLVGWNDRGKISTSYSTGRVDGDVRVGGLVGYNYRGSITASYNTGTVTGNEDVGGLVGDYDFGSISHSFWDIETSGQTTSAAGTGKTTAEMQMASTFLEAGWDFVYETANGTEDIWWILEGQDYPRLWWEAIE